jgi:hypothetical protein
MIPVIRTNLKFAVSCTLCLAAIGFSQPKTGASNGKMDGVKSWTLPNAPSGTRPDQAWHSVGSAPDGDIYISGHDHASNSMLYRLSQKDDTLRWVGDARTASQAANNWQNGETCQKFHVRPTYLNGKVYAASLDRSTLDNAWQSTRGFHWYAYDIGANTFTDLSATEPNGVAAEHLQVVTITVDPLLNAVYGATIPECKIVSYDVAKKATKVLGRPAQWAAQNYVYSNRCMFVDSRSRLYFSAGNERGQWYMGENKTVFNKMFYYDPAGGFGELPAFPLQGANAIEVGQWNREHTKWYCTSDQGHLYCFDDATATWTFLGRPNFDAGPKVWSLWVSPDGEKLYIGRGEGGSVIVEFDLATKTAHDICSIGEVDAAAGGTNFMTGYDTWDRSGNIYVADFSMNDGRNVVLTRINPVKIKAAKKLLPELVQVSFMATASNDVAITRTGATTAELKVIYQVDGMSAAGMIVQSTFGETTIPAGQASVTVALGSIKRPTAPGIASAVFSAESDGNDYIANGQKIVLPNPAGVRDNGRVASARSINAFETVRNLHGTFVIRLSVGQAAMTQINLYTVSGKLVRTLVNRHLSAGSHDIALANNGGGRSIPAVLVAEVNVGSESIRQRVILY